VKTAVDFRTFYSKPGEITSAGKYGRLFDELPADVATLCEVTQGLIMHRDWAPHMRVILSDARVQETNLRTVSRQTERILELDDSPLAVKRPKEKRLIGTCRDFCAFTVAMLRGKGIPARARCGFAGYFSPGKHEDHWVVEYWKEDESRWNMVDAQLDKFQRAALKIDFNPLDMPPGQFLTGGEAWQKCRQKLADPETFGIFDMHGMWFIAGNLIRDLLSLNKVELLPWDVWTSWPAFGPERPFTHELTSWLDKMATLTLAGNEAFAELRSTCESHPWLKEPPGWPIGSFGAPGI